MALDIVVQAILKIHWKIYRNLFKNFSEDIRYIYTYTVYIIIILKKQEKKMILNLKT